MKVSSSHAVKGIALLASVVVLAGCNQGGDNDNSQATNQPTSVVTKSSTATPSSESTATSEDSSSDVAESDEQDAAEAEDSNGKTAAQVMLFHNGRFIKTVSQKPTNPPYIRRIDDSTINVTWEWPKPGEPQAAPTGRSVAMFRWDDQSESVVMEGELPPD